MSEENELCPCGSGKLLKQCCRPIITGEQPAKTAEALMRSRYSAYVLKNTDYLKVSWHPDTRPEQIDLEETPITWTGLSVIRTQAGAEGDSKGVVEFVAHYDKAGKQGKIHETSRFECKQGQWLYLDGDYKAAAKVGRNEPCPCGSGKKYKRCCGAG